MEREDLPRYLGGIKDWMAKRGYRLNTEAPVSRLEEVEFCQGRYVATVPPTLVRNPVKAITQDHAWVTDPTLDHRDVLAATGLGGLSLYGAVPVLCAYYHMLAKTTTVSQRTLRRLNFTDSWLRCADLSTAARMEVTEEARYSFWLAWGISPGEQRALEEAFDRFDTTAYHRLDTIYDNDLHEFSIFNSPCLL
jgi:hypothetical protein